MENRVWKSSLKADKRGKILWLTGNTGAGKTTWMRRFAEIDPSLIQLDGDELREIFPASMSKTDRWEHCMRVARMAALFADQGHNVVVAVIAPYKALREQIKEEYGVVFAYVPGGAENSPETPYEIPGKEATYRLLRE